MDGAINTSGLFTKIKEIKRLHTIRIMNMSEIETLLGRRIHCCACCILIVPCAVLIT